MEGYADAGVVFDGTEAFGRVARVVAVGRGLDGLATPASGLADLRHVGRVILEVGRSIYHLVHGHRAIGQGTGTENDTEDVVPRAR